MSDVKQNIMAKVAGKKVVMYSKPSCPFCSMAKEVLKKYNLSSEDYEIIEIDRDPQCSAIQNALQEITGGRTVPRVFIKGTCIGGGTETRNLDSSGQLRTMLTSS